MRDDHLPTARVLRQHSFLLTTPYPRFSKSETVGSHEESAFAQGEGSKRPDVFQRLNRITAPLPEVVVSEEQ